ncbi:lytic transglycosylase domain-containing protein [Sulfurihydrogenibium sp.]|uniref:lytic transglycosylase domain-containing protein n=1 Tax=Sulfurihydrogenibium sp. TaxID=2053621 RepID=UPI0026362602|nr:lytic transglycosylase domain-containing protein [Sulfurihydrogenibium sp.]
MMRKILITLLLTIGISFAKVPYQECFFRAAMQYDIPYQLLVAIAKIESGFRPWVININQNGRSVKVINPKSVEEAAIYLQYLHDNGYNYDVGVGQINVRNIKRLGLRPQQLLDPCNNIMVSAYILKENVLRYGLTWEAIWRYNGRRDYAYKVYNALVSMGAVTRR